MFVLFDGPLVMMLVSMVSWLVILLIFVQISSVVGWVVLIAIVTSMIVIIVRSSMIFIILRSAFRIKVVQVWVHMTVLFAMIKIHLKRLFDIMPDVEVLFLCMLRLHFENHHSSARENVLRVENTGV